MTMTRSPGRNRRRADVPDRTAESPRTLDADRPGADNLLFAGFRPPVSVADGHLDRGAQDPRSDVTSEVRK